MRQKIKKIYSEKIKSLKLSSAVNARKLALKLRDEYSEIKQLVDYGYQPDEAVKILSSFPNLIISEIEIS